MSVILLYNSPIKSSNVVQCGEFFIAKRKPLLDLDVNLSLQFIDKI